MEDGAAPARAASVVAIRSARSVSAASMRIRCGNGNAGSSPQASSATTRAASRSSTVHARGSNREAATRLCERALRR